MSKALVESIVGSVGIGTQVASTSTYALAYARVSTDRQEEMGLSIPAQIKAIQAYAQANGIELVEVFQEAASGFQNESRRVEFQRMLERAMGDKRISKILVHEYSRFSRDAWKTPQIVGDLRAKGVAVISVTEQSYDIDTVMGLWMQKVTEAKNAAYSMEVAFHTRKGMKQNASMKDPDSGRCYKNGGKPPWGYRTVRVERLDSRGRPAFKATWELDTEVVGGRPRWEWMRELLVRASQGASLDALRDMLNEGGVPAPRGGYWGTSTIHSLLEPHMLLQYAGYGTWGVRKKRRQRWNDPQEWEVMENAHPAIITAEVAQAIAQARASARETYANPSSRMAQVKSSASRFVLTGGLFRCARCGANMVGHTDRGRDGYVCGAAKYRRGMGCGPRVFVEKDLVEDAVWDTLEVWAASIDGGPRSQAVRKLNAELRKTWESQGGQRAAQVAERLRKIDEKTANIRGLLENGLQDVVWANKRLSELAAEREAARASAGDQGTPTRPPEVDFEALVQCLRNVRELLPHATRDERRLLAKRMLQEVTLDPDTRQVEVRVKLPANTVQRVEAAGGIEPPHRGFADLCLTTWLRRPGRLKVERKTGFEPATSSLGSWRSTN